MIRQRKIFILTGVLLALLLGAGVSIPALADGKRSGSPPVGTWTHDLFGTGDEVRVDYAATRNNHDLSLEIGEIATPAGIEYRIIDEDGDDEDRDNKDRDDEDRDDEDKASKNDGDEQGLEIWFAYGEARAKLKVKAELDDDAPKVKFELEVKGDTTPAAPGIGELAGDHAWSGQLCDGQPFTIFYSLSGQSVAVLDVVGPPSTVETKKHSARIRFDSAHAAVTIALKKIDARVHGLEIEAKLGKCREPGNPVVDTQVPTPTTPAPTIPEPTPAPTTPEPTTPTPTTPTPTTPAPTPTTVLPTTTTAPPPTTTTAPPTTMPPTTVPRQVKYLTYLLPSGQVTIRLDDPPALKSWAITSPDWAYFTSKDTPSAIKILFSHRVTDEQGELSVKLVNGVPVASFTSDSGGVVTPAQPTESTVAPPTTAASMA